MTTESLVVYEGNTAVDIPAIGRDPGAVLAEAQKAATALRDAMGNKPKKVMFNGKQYLEFGDWQTVGKFYGVTTRIETQPKYIEFQLSEDVKVFGFEAQAVAICRGEIIGGASAMCMSDEPNWKARPLFMLSSMAQTRAQAKALRSVLGWVVELAGYASTPAEEIQEVTGTATTPPAVAMPQRKSNATPTPRAKVHEPAAAGEIKVEANFLVQAYEQKEGATWTLTKIVTDSGLELSTFSTDFGLVLKTAHDTGGRLTATYMREESKKKPGVFNNVIKTIEGAEEAAAKGKELFG